jgi:hypothetical protein
MLEIKHFCHIRPQTEENWASRPLCHTQASDRQISSWVGDHQRIPAVVCFYIFFAFVTSTANRNAGIVAIRMTSDNDFFCEVRFRESGWLKTPFFVGSNHALDPEADVWQSKEKR